MMGSLSNGQIKAVPTGQRGGLWGQASTGIKGKMPQKAVPLKALVPFPGRHFQMTWSVIHTSS